MTSIGKKMKQGHGQKVDGPKVGGLNGTWTCSETSRALRLTRSYEITFGPYIMTRILWQEIFKKWAGKEVNADQDGFYNTIANVISSKVKNWWSCDSHDVSHDFPSRDWSKNIF